MFLLSRKSPLFLTLSCLVAMMYMFLVLTVPMVEAKNLVWYIRQIAVGVLASAATAAFVRYLERRERDLPTDIANAERDVGQKQGKVDKINADIDATMREIEKQKEKMADAAAILRELPLHPISPTQKKRRKDALRAHSAAKYRLQELDSNLINQNQSLRNAKRDRDKAQTKLEGFQKEQELLPGRLKRAKEDKKQAKQLLDSLRLDYQYHQILHQRYGAGHV